jgi:hypothetical protein
MFIGSDRGGRTAATPYGLVASCKRHQADPFAYLKDVLERLPTPPPTALIELLQSPGRRRILGRDAESLRKT